MKYTSVRFDNAVNREFTKALMQRVNQYFKSNQVSRNGNFNMWFKTFFMLSLYTVPFVVVVMDVLEPQWLNMLMYTLMGLGVAGIGLSIMHDANHGAYSKKKWVNNLFGMSLNFVGGNAMNWKIQHNYLHHTFTNVDGLDEDIDPGGLLRFSPHAPKKGFHRFQHIYGWLLYSLMTIMWVINKDYKQMIGYQKRGLIEKQGTTFGKEMTILIVSKIFYFSYVLVLPLLVTDIHWAIIVGGFVWAHLIAGFILAAIFQPAHVLPENTYPLPVDPGVIEDSFMIHQLRTTADFAHRNRLLSWYVGGLNYQVEHHLFPNICHVHYRKLAPIVAETAREFNVPYHSFPTFRGALKAHHKMLFQLGRA